MVCFNRIYGLATFSEIWLFFVQRSAGNTAHHSSIKLHYPWVLDAAAAAETLVNFFTKLENNSKWRQVNGKFRMLTYFLILVSSYIFRKATF